jgi:hypothetical protein
MPLQPSENQQTPGLRMAVPLSRSHPQKSGSLVLPHSKTLPRSSKRQNNAERLGVRAAAAAAFREAPDATAAFRKIANAGA